ncbi:two-component system response regulator, partial [Candidatus Omnitrophota bacterium]
MAEQLKKKGYDVATAENGEEGLQRFDQEKSDLILLDVVMPGMDGFGFFKAIKKDPQKSQTPVIVLTARGGMKATFEAFEADDFITKPFDVEDLLAKIEFCLAKKALVFGDDPAFINVVKKALEKSKCQVEV